MQTSFWCIMTLPAPDHLHSYSAQTSIQTQRRQTNGKPIENNDTSQECDEPDGTAKGSLGEFRVI